MKKFMHKFDKFFLLFVFFCIFAHIFLLFFINIVYIQKITLHAECAATRPLQFFHLKERCRLLIDMFKVYQNIIQSVKNIIPPLNLQFLIAYITVIYSFLSVSLAPFLRLHKKIGYFPIPNMIYNAVIQTKNKTPYIGVTDYSKHNIQSFMVGTTGLEPVTSCTSSMRSSQLS